MNKIDSVLITGPFRLEQHRAQLASSPGPIPSPSMLHAEKIGEPGDEARRTTLQDKRYIHTYIQYTNITLNTFS